MRGLYLSVGNDDDDDDDGVIAVECPAIKLLAVLIQAVESGKEQRV